MLGSRPDRDRAARGREPAGRPVTGGPELRAAVVGAGTMGHGIAQLLGRAGIPCRVADVSPERAEAACARAIAGARAYEASGLFVPGAAAAVAANLSAAASIGDASAGADVVFEAVAEQVGVKADVLAEIERYAPAGCVIASNTSAIPIRELAATLDRPERFLGAHWFNPPQWVPCVELIAGPAHRPSGGGARARAARAARQAARAGRRLGRVRREPDPVRDVQGGGGGRRRRCGDGGAGGRDRALVVRAPAGGLRAVHDRGHGRARRVRRGLCLARGRPGRALRAAPVAARARRPGPPRHEDGRRLPRARRRRDRRARAAARRDLRRARRACAGVWRRGDRAAWLPSQRLDGEHALVTGAGRGIGRGGRARARRGGRHVDAGRALAR